MQQQTDRPQQSLLSYSTDQLTRKPLPSLHYRSTSSSLLQQRGTPSLLSQGKSLLRPMSTGGNSFTPSLKLSTPMVSSGTTGFSSAHKSISSQTKSGTSLTRSSSLKDNFTRAKSLTAFATPRLSKTTSSSALSRPDVAGDSAPLFSVEKFVTPVVSWASVIRNIKSLWFQHTDTFITVFFIAKNVYKQASRITKLSRASNVWRSFKCVAGCAIQTKKDKFSWLRGIVSLTRILLVKEWEWLAFVNWNCIVVCCV